MRVRPAWEKLVNLYLKNKIKTKSKQKALRAWLEWYKRESLSSSASTASNKVHLERVEE